MVLLLGISNYWKLIGNLIDFEIQRWRWPRVRKKSKKHLWLHTELHDYIVRLKYYCDSYLRKFVVDACASLACDYMMKGRTQHRRNSDARVTIRGSFTAVTRFGRTQFINDSITISIIITISRDRFHTEWNRKLRKLVHKHFSQHFLTCVWRTSNANTHLIWIALLMLNQCWGLSYRFVP